MLLDFYKETERERCLEMASEHIRIHHGYEPTAIKDPDKRHSGYITFAVKKTDEEIARDKASGRSSSPWSQRHYTYHDLQRKLRKLLAEFAGRDVYISANTFFRPRRIADYVRQYRALWVDLDCYDVGMKPVEVLRRLEREIFGKKLPMPSRVVFSGGEDGGLWAFWDLEPVPHINRAGKRFVDGPGVRWSALQRHFSYVCRDFGADYQAIDSARVVRLAGTTNTKTDQLAECIVYDDETRYSLETLAAEYLPDVPALKERVNAAKKRRKPRKKSQAIRDAVVERFDRLRADLRKLCELRGWNIKGAPGWDRATGRPKNAGREYLLFIYRNFCEAVHGDSDLALHETFELNAQFVEPLDDDEVEYQTASRTTYFYKNQTLIELFRITDEEQRHMSELVGRGVQRERRQAYWRDYQARKREEEGVQPREERRAADIRRLAEALKSEPDASLRRLAEIVGFKKDKVGKLRPQAEEVLSEKPHLNMVELHPMLVELTRGLVEAAASSEEAGLPLHDGLDEIAPNVEAVLRRIQTKRTRE